MENLYNYSLKAEKTDFDSVKIGCSMDAYNVIKQFYFDDIVIFESSFILMLNAKNKTIGFAKISQGGTCGTVIDVKIIAKFAIDCLASSVVLAHNHPSGTLTPSSHDLKVTSKVKEALSLLDIILVDHLILTSENYYSLADEGKL